MSIGQRGVDEDELTESSIPELFAILGEKDTPRLYAQPFKVDFSHDVPMGGGNSVDRKTVYIDRGLYAECMDNEFKATGLTPAQILDRWCDHEHTEITINYGDNYVDTYIPAHERALRKEHEGVIAILGNENRNEKIRNYEETIWPGLLRAYHRPIKKPPLDLWCSPHLDDPGMRDEEILEAMRRLGVFDAGKRAKYETHYGAGTERCKSCAMFKPAKMSAESGQLAWCDSVSGMVRDNRWCELWLPKNAT